MGLDHPELSPLCQFSSSHELLRELRDSFFLGGTKDHGDCFVISEVAEPSGSTSPTGSCFQKFIVGHEHKMNSPLVSRKGNPEYAPAGVRIVLLDQAPVQFGLIENSAELLFQEGPSMDRAWSQGRVPKGSCLQGFVSKPSESKFVDPLIPLTSALA